jgi:hypothetical protein
VREGLRYQFPPPEHKHVLGPFTAGQLVIALLVALLGVFGIARPNPTVPGIALAAGLLVAVGVPVLVPWRGRVVTEWAPIALGYAAARLFGRADFRSAAPRLGTAGAGRLALPPEVGDVEFLTHPHNGGLLGVAVDRRTGVYTGVLELQAPSFLLEDPPRQEELLARWGGVLARLADAGTDATVILISPHAEADFADLIAETTAAGFVPKSELSAAAIRRLVSATRER